MARGRRSARVAPRRRHRSRARPKDGRWRPALRRTSGGPGRGWAGGPWSEPPDLHADRALGTAMDELVDMGVTRMVDIGGAALPDQLALVEHGDAMADLACRGHVVGDRDGGGAEV